jgi:predicted flap endonuclease-1-like 5' DNA nuclease
MNFAEDMWLRGQAAQRNFLHVTSYSTAFAGTAALQALHMGLTAPRSFWAAMARAAATPVVVPETVPKTKAAAKTAPNAVADPAAEPATASVVPMTPDTPLPTAAEAVQAAPVTTAPAPAAVPDPEPAAEGPNPHLLDEPRGGKPDDLTVLAGVGAKLAAALNEFGIYHFDQIATLDEEGIAWLDAQQKGFRMICARYDLVGQARALS